MQLLLNLVYYCSNFISYIKIYQSKKKWEKNIENLYRTNKFSVLNYNGICF